MGIANGNKAMMPRSKYTNRKVKDIKALPVMLPEDTSVTNATKQTITLAKEDWDSFETSFDFCKHKITLRF